MNRRNFIKAISILPALPFLHRLLGSNRDAQAATPATKIQVEVNNEVPDGQVYGWNSKFAETDYITNEYWVPGIKDDLFRKNKLLLEMIQRKAEDA